MTEAETVESLVADLLEWIGPDARPYDEVLAAWGTSCPRLPVWEDANDRGFLQRSQRERIGAVVAVTARGAAFLAQHRARP